MPHAPYPENSAMDALTRQSTARGPQTEEGPAIGPGFPSLRLRRLRRTPALRGLAEETRLTAGQLVAPLFLTEAPSGREPVASLPGVDRLSLPEALREIEELRALGVLAVLPFAKVPDERKDNEGSYALDPEGFYARTIRAIKKSFPDVCVMTDVALDPYSIYGHDGIVRDGVIVNDETIAILGRMAVVHADAGADVVAPSDMMDGRVAAIRHALELSSHPDVAILAYSAKYASSLYGPFRDALDSAPGFGDKKTYQMNPANVREALREVALDLQEGADIVMVKPAGYYLDVIARVRAACDAPIAAYQVSGEYAQIMAAVERGWADHDRTMMESLIAIRRAGADIILTYFARAAAAWLRANAS
jgi:porphobilinogen synthase